MALKTTRSAVRRRSGLGADSDLVRAPVLRGQKLRIAQLLRNEIRRKSVETKKKIRVLVAEDEQRLLNVASRSLSRRGMVVCKVQNANQIISATEQFRPHVLVIDDYFEKSGTLYSAIMPELVGRFPAVRVIVTSAAGSAKRATAGDPKVWGAKAVIPKETLVHEVDLEQSVRAAAGID